MPFLSPNQQCQSTEGVVVQDTILKKTKNNRAGENHGTAQAACIESSCAISNDYCSSALICARLGRRVVLSGARCLMAS